MIGRFPFACHALDPFCSRQRPSRAQQSTLLMGINPAVGSGCNHCMAHGTWDHASDRASITAPLPRRPTSVACRFLIIEIRDGAPVPSSSPGMAPHPGSRASDELRTSLDVKFCPNCASSRSQSPLVLAIGVVFTPRLAQLDHT